ncbi:ATP-binding domain-containing protein [Parvibacter caecicola]|uniref:UvrD-like helicase C-terminal domain-containing protein n=1 Tax=Parvibacter caecicola TaxID=747645 RepID=A0A7W5CZW0_9ACTN|nr:ATP-binding domain-containing protein [Parvibacter caecicola]MBB3170314.1 hypothetical protein [Parvibacter caecicola]MCR2041721.1 ATP-binding domain-containing protein [Parvibacter caecicola]RNL09331.1 hypothetical protein DMP11_09140 [Parvibacter caecicola]
MERVIAETDFISLLLNHQAEATDDQRKILEHPRRNNQSTIVRIKGLAGSGKTLCLLAKLLQEAVQIPPDAPDTEENALLFVCFNREMAHYAANLLKPFPEAKRIRVTTFDSLVYQMLMPTYNNKRKPVCSDVAFPAGETWKLDYSHQFTGQAMEIVGERYPQHKGAFFVDTHGKAADKNIAWMNDELCWLEAHYLTEQEAKLHYPAAPRIGRGGVHKPRKEVRPVILEVWHEQRRLLAQERRFTLEQAVNRLLKSRELPRFSMIAVDEAQDLATRSIELLLAMRENMDTRVYMAVDENQRIYQRDFSWKQLGVHRRATTYSLAQNLRSNSAVYAFAQRCQGIFNHTAPKSECVQLVRGGEKEVLDLAVNLAAQPNRTTLLVGGPDWDAKLLARGVVVRNPMAKVCAAAEGRLRDEVDISKPGLYVMGELKCKGLEFDNVLVPSLACGADAPEDARRRRYVHFTRARHNLYVVTGPRVPAWAKEAYNDLL